MLAMQQRVLDGSMDHVRLSDIVNSTGNRLSPARLVIYRQLFRQMVADVYRLRARRYAELEQRIATRTASRCIQIDWLANEQHELVQLIDNGSPMSLIVAAGRYADSNSGACAVAAYLYHSCDATKLTDEQLEALAAQLHAHSRMLL